MTEETEGDDKKPEVGPDVFGLKIAM